MVNAVGSVGQIGRQAGVAVAAEMTPEELVRCIDFRYITDCITPQEALALLKQRAEGKSSVVRLLQEAIPATTTRRLAGVSGRQSCAACAEAVDAGFSYLKLKVGRDLEDDIRRVRIAREVIGRSPADDRRQPCGRWTKPFRG